MMECFQFGFPCIECDETVSPIHSGVGAKTEKKSASKKNNFRFDSMKSSMKLLEPVISQNNLYGARQMIM